MAGKTFSPNGADVCNLVICFDGTWNTEDPDFAENDDFTNVFLLQDSVIQDAIYNIEGRKFISHVTYVEGPGTKKGHKVAGGFFAADLDEAIKEGYRDLFKNCRKCLQAGVEVRIFLFGFSRGAYICHVFSWLLQVVGIPDFTLRECNAAVDAFLSKDPGLIKKATDGCDVAHPSIVLMGLWDVVSSYADKFRGYFNGLKSPLVGRIRHAMAADERRELFPVMHYLPNDAIRQVWFPGVHSEVGGGYANDKSLHHLSLDWMIQETEQVGLRFSSHKKATRKIDWAVLPEHCPLTSRDYAVRCYWPQDELHDSLLERAAATFRPVEFDNFESDNVNIRL